MPILHDDQRPNIPARIAPKLDNKGHELPKLGINQRIIIQHPLTKRWSTYGYIIGIRATGRSYIIKDDNGAIFVRNRRFIRPTSIGDRNLLHHQIGQDESQEKAEKTPIFLPRRSKRLEEKAGAKGKKLHFSPERSTVEFDSNRPAASLIGDFAF